MKCERSHFKIYLIFDPKVNTDFSNENISRYEDIIYNDYDAKKNEIKSCDMEKLFEAVVLFQSKNLDIQKVGYNFEFKLVSQNDYHRNL